MPEESIWPSSINALIVAGFVVGLLLYIASDMSVTHVKMKESFERLEAKHYAHVTYHCLKKGKEYIELDKISKSDLRKCGINVKVEIIDIITGEKKQLSYNWFGNRNHEIAINIKSGDSIHPGWLRIEY